MEKITGQIKIIFCPTCEHDTPHQSICGVLICLEHETDDDQDRRDHEG